MYISPAVMYTTVYIGSQGPGGGGGALRECGRP